MNIIEKVLRLEVFADDPPVLVDIGAAGSIHGDWKAIAKYAICIAFDADERGMGYIAKENSGYRKLFVYKCIVTPNKSSETDFYLTRSAPCSSSLHPDIESLNKWAFADLFTVEKKITLRSVTLPAVIKELGLDRVDWFKTDSQGTDLSLFNSLGEQLIKKVLIAEFEPGIIDAYVGEDKLWSLMAYMDKHDFWMSDIIVKGSERIRTDLLAAMHPLERGFVAKGIKVSPCWAEVSYVNYFKDDFSKRDLLLGWVFAYIKKQYGFTLELAVLGYKKFNDPIFMLLKDHSLASIRRSYITFPARYLKTIFGKFVRR